MLRNEVLKIGKMEQWNIGILENNRNNLLFPLKSITPSLHYSSIPSFHGSGINQELLKNL